MAASALAQQVMFEAQPPFVPFVTPNPTALQEYRYVSYRIWAKRDDLYVASGIGGGKVRTCLHLVHQAKGIGATGIVTAGSRHSPQVSIVARLAHEYKLPCYVFVPAAPKQPHTPEIADAIAHAATVHYVKPGHNSVIIARARAFAKEHGFAEVPFGMECWEAVRQTAAEFLATTWPRECSRVVVPVGSGMTAAGILWGMRLSMVPGPRKLLGIQVGAAPQRRLAKYAPSAWERRLELRYAGVPYNIHVDATLGLGGDDVTMLDPVYEAKCLRFLARDDCLWVVGVRATL